MYARPQCTFYRVCRTREAQKRCYRCGTAKPESAFEVAAWKARNADRRICKDCVSNVKGEKPMERFQYACPFCETSVTSSVRTGQIDHRHACGNRFRVKDGHVAAREFVYVCPFCEGTLASNVKTGEIDHRTVCGNRFYVKEGSVSAKAAREFVYVCPFCEGTLASNVKTGRIDHRTVCGNQYVKEGAVSAKTRQHPHKCPACHAVVWSSQLFGRIRSRHNTPAGKPCPEHSWQVGQRKRETKK